MEKLKSNTEHFCEVYLADISPLAEDEALYRELCRRLPDGRRQKADAMRFAEGRACSAGTFFLLLRALKTKGLEPTERDFTYGAHGKPDLAERFGMHFNISHSKTLAMCVLSDCEAGCDAEYIGKDLSGIARRFFNPGELEMLKKIRYADERKLMQYRLWTLKESYMKASGLGFDLPLANFRIDFADGIPFVSEHPGCGDYSLYEIQGESGCCLSCCLKAPRLENIGVIRCEDLFEKL